MEGEGGGLNLTNLRDAQPSGKEHVPKVYTVPSKHNENIVLFLRITFWEESSPTATLRERKIWR